MSALSLNTFSLDRLRFKKVDKLVALSVLGAVALAWGFVVAFDALIVFAREANDVGTGSYTLTKAIVYVLLTIPRRAYQFFAYGSMIGVLTGMGALAASGELIALRAAGLSKLRICASVVFALTMITALVVLMGETIAPRAEQRAETLQANAKAKNVMIGKRGSLWARDGETIINARHPRPIKNGTALELSDVRIYEFTPIGQLLALSLAKTATQENGEWVLYDVHRTVFQGHSAKSTDLAQMSWKSALDPKVLATSMVTQAEYLSLADLSNTIDYYKRNHQDVSAYQLAYWGRISYPLNVLVLAFCAVPFAFGALRTGGLGKRLFIGMALAISYYFFQQAVVKTGAVYNFNFALVNALPSILLALAAFFYFRRNA